MCVRLIIIVTLIVALLLTAYCLASDLPSRTFKGPSSGFVVTKVITSSYDSQGEYLFLRAYLFLVLYCMFVIYKLMCACTYTLLVLASLTGYVGYLPSDQSIYVVFRGNSNIANWIASLQFAMTAYSGTCCSLSCKIHTGFNTIGSFLFLLMILYINQFMTLYICI